MLDGRLSYWPARLHFGLLLFIFGELVAWQHGATYTLTDWLAVLVIYLAAAALLLDIIARCNVKDMKSLLITGGIFGLIQGMLISLSAVDIENFTTGLLFRTLGMEVIMFLLAFACFWLLSSSHSVSIWAFVAAGAVGWIAGTWARWLPPEIGQPIPTFSESMPYVIIGLVLAGILPMLLPPFKGRMQALDWYLTPYESAVTGGALGVALVLRSQHMDSFGLSVSISLIIMLFVMVFFTRNVRRGCWLDSITPPQLPHITSWLLMLIPFLLLGWLGYHMSDGNELPIQADVLFNAITLFGIVWVPLVSIVLGVSSFIQLTQEGYW